MTTAEELIQSLSSVDDSKFSDDELLKTRTVLLTGNDVEAKRQEIREYFHKTFTLYEKLFEILIDDDSYYEQPEKLRHPLIFYYGHTAVFYINKLRLGKLLSYRLNEYYESLCAVGVDEMSWDDLNNKHYNWPSVDDLRHYRNQTRQTIDHLIQTMSLSLPINWSSSFWPILMGIEHERIHLETSSVLFRQLPIERVRSHPLFKLCKQLRNDRLTVPKNELLLVDNGHVNLGKDDNHELYGWDNEYGEYESDVKSFSASRFLVSNAEYYEFILDNGYNNQDYWGDEGWKFITYKNAQHPVFWVPIYDKDNNLITYRYRSMTEIIDMPWDWPVDVNYIEAKAFCRWLTIKKNNNGKVYRLPTEDEWTRLRDSCLPNHHDDDQPYWKQAPGNINLEHYASSTPIDMFEFNNGFYDVIGNVWQHTETPIMGFKHFRYHPLYDDFSVPTFDLRHNLIKGGSWISTGNEATRLARYAFRRHFYQHAGFRYIESDHDIVINEQSNMTTEHDQVICKMIDTHFGKNTYDIFNQMNQLNIKNHTVTIAELAIEYCKQAMKQPVYDATTNQSIAITSLSRCCDIGCAAGRTSFELAKQFQFVHGLDQSARYIRIGSLLQSKQTLSYTLNSEGDLESYHEVDLKQIYDDKEIDELSSKIEFMQADVCNWDRKYRDYDCIVACNLLEELLYPQSFLSVVHERIRPGGLLILSSSYHYDEKITDKQHWLGGIKQAGESITSIDTIESILSKHFRLFNSNNGNNNNQQQQSINLPCINRINDRMFEYRLSHVTIWQRLAN